MCTSYLKNIFRTRASSTYYSKFFYEVLRTFQSAKLFEFCAKNSGRNSSSSSLWRLRLTCQYKKFCSIVLRRHNSKNFPDMIYTPHILSLFHHNHSSLALFGLFLQHFWPAPPEKTAQKVQGSYGCGETKREVAIFLKFWTVACGSETKKTAPIYETIYASHRELFYFP